MENNSHLDLHSVINSAAKTQVALLDVSVMYWQTVIGQSVAFSELWAQTLQSLQSGEPQLAQSARRIAEFTVSNATEFGKLAVKISNAMIEISANLNTANTPAGTTRR